MQLGKSKIETPLDPILGKINSGPLIAKLSRTIWPGVLFIVLATVVAYWPVFSAGFIWDDDAYVTQNTLLSAPDGWWRIWFSAHYQSQYFPLVYSTLRLEYALWGLNPMGYHIVNVGLHIINSLLAWALLQRLSLPGAWLAAAIFALHPVQVETVAWVTELKNTESTCFYLLAVLAWLNFCGGGLRRFYGLALFLYALALFAKTTACTLPAVLLLVLWVKSEPVNRRRILQVTPFMALGVAMGLLSVWWEKHLDNYLPKFHLPGSFPERLLIATHAVWFYAGKVFWPAQLTFSYPKWTIDTGDAWQYGWLAACLAVAVLLWIKRLKPGRGVPAMVMFFVAVLSPMLGFIPLYTFYYTYVADHYQYLACLGLIAGFAAATVWFFEKSRADRQLKWALTLLLLFTLGTLTHRQCAPYQNLEILWLDTLEKNPRSWMAHTNLARLLVRQGNFDAAETHYETALEINPKEEDIHYNYGNLLARTGRLDAALAEYEQAVALNPVKPDPHNNLGALLLKLHRPDEAMAQYQQAILLAPDTMSYHYNLGSALVTEHQTDAAIKEFQRALQLAPDTELIKRRLRELGVNVD